MKAVQGFGASPPAREVKEDSMRRQARASTHPVPPDVILIVWAGMTLVVLLGLSIPGSGAAAEGAPSFAGAWKRDPEQSDDAQGKLREAFEAMRQGSGRRMGSGGPPPGGGQGGGSRRSGRGRPESPGALMGPMSDKIVLEHEGTELRIDDGERVQIFYLDGRKHPREMPNGAKLETVATLDGLSIRIEEKLDRGRIERRLELAGDAKTMVMTVNLKLDNMKEPVHIRTVYEREE